MYYPRNDEKHVTISDEDLVGMVREARPHPQVI